MTIRYKQDGEYLEDFSLLVETMGNENVRTYANQNGDVFTLADSTTEDGKPNTKVVIDYGYCVGDIIFYNLTEDEIHEILDCIKHNN